MDNVVTSLWYILNQMTKLYLKNVAKLTSQVYVKYKHYDFLNLLYLELHLNEWSGFIIFSKIIMGWNLVCQAQGPGPVLTTPMMTPNYVLY